MKLVISIINTVDRESVIEGLIQNGYCATQINSIGGFTGKENITVLTAVNEENVEKVIETIKQHTKSQTVDVSQELNREVLYAKVNGTTVFVIDIEKFIQIQN